MHSSTIKSMLAVGIFFVIAGVIFRHLKPQGGWKGILIAGGIFVITAIAGACLRLL